jgi:hypothetical protein
MELNRDSQHTIAISPISASRCWSKKLFSPARESMADRDCWLADMIARLLPVLDTHVAEVDKRVPCLSGPRKCD